MKILFINESTLIKGGVDTLVTTEIYELQRRGFITKLLEFSHKNYLESNFLKKLKNVHLYFSENEKLSLVKNEIKTFKPDIIHFHNTYPFLRNPLWSDEFFKTIKVIQHLHNYYPFCLNSFFYREGKICTDCFVNNSFRKGVKKSCYNYSKIKSYLAAYNRPTPQQWIEFSKNVDLFIGVSQFIVDKYIELGISYEKIKTLYNGITVNQIKENISQGEYVLFLGNIVNAKGVEIVCQLAKRNNDIEFKIAGSGRDLLSLKKKYNNLKNITFEGYVDGEKKRELLNNCKFLLFPVLSWESFGLVILESFAFGKPVITSGLGGTSELVEDGVTGFIIKDNNINSYEKVVRNLLGNSVNFNVLKDNQYTIANRFSIENHVENLIDIYNTLV